MPESLARTVNPPQRNGTAQKILWTLFGLALTIILVLIAGWATSVEKRLDGLTNILDRRLDKIAESMDGVAREQARRTSRIEHLEAEAERARGERAEIFRRLDRLGR